MRVLIVDDHQLFSGGVAPLIAREFDAEVRCVGSCEAALQCLEGDATYDLVLLDLELPGISGIEGISLLAAKLPAARIVAVTSHTEPLVREAVLKRGASAYVGKSESLPALMRALREVMLRHPAAAGAALQASLPITARQREVLLHVAQGKSNKVIARQLDMSENTVRNHVAAVLDALGVDNRHEATLAACKLGLM